MGQLVGIRAQALAWWRGLENDIKVELVKKHFPNYDFVLVDTSSSRIEIIFIAENKLTIN